ncbi:hypothetical protein [Amycolatopsis sp. NPDC001319]|uniref:hypothetical protein n=1 Tax=unclassified Amycolatopsis TaxID=2618356 RepID=UPI0036779129
MVAATTTTGPAATGRPDHPPAEPVGAYHRAASEPPRRAGACRCTSYCHKPTTPACRLQAH